ncbi:MAG TPA: diaminopropionate ammonia-lyase [Clostridia bacterium]|nr:diaminopropionate ammonia-lyase [Clostridia bacterium]
MSKVMWTKNALPKTDDRYLSLMDTAAVESAQTFHRSFPEYAVTPLQQLNGFAKELGLGGLYVKDESYRFGLNAFKVLGGSFAIGKFVAGQLGRNISEVDYAFLTSEYFKSSFAPCTFFTATDGNHGRGVAWAANRLGQKAVVLMPKGTVRSRYENIKKLGADVTIEKLNYDDCVRKAALLSSQIPASVVVQDTAWEGYEEIPAHIMQGYGTLIAEAIDQMGQNGVVPTHVFVQAGVGSLAATVQGYLINRFPESAPKVVVMECRAADCFYRSAVARDGKAQAVGGALNSIMAGLCCGEASPIAWDILKNHVTAFCSCDDSVSAAGMRRLSSPVGGDPRIISGESGAVGMGLIDLICRSADYVGLRDALGLDAASQVLLISTEGDTDPERYRAIVWDGAFPSAD